MATSALILEVQTRRKEEKAEITMHAVKSSNVKYVGYDTMSKVLYIKFKSGDNVYAYKGVSKITAANLLNASSVGGYFHSLIKDNYDFDILENPKIGKVKRKK